MKEEKGRVCLNLKKSIISTVLVSVLISAGLSLIIMLVLETLYPSNLTIIDFDDYGNVVDVHTPELTPAQQTLYKVVRIVQPTLMILCFVGSNYWIISYYYNKNGKRHLRRFLTVRRELPTMIWTLKCMCYFLTS